MKKVIVTGADGFIGSHLTEQLIKKGFKVATIPAKWKKRVEGHSSINLKSYFSYLKVLWKSL